MKVLIVSADRFEDSELLVPLYRLREEGIAVDLAAPARGTIRGKHGYEVEVTKPLGEVRPEEYDLLILPGGEAPAALSRDPAARAIAASFFERRKPVAAICHGPLLLARAKLLDARRATCYRSVAAELRSAGARYEDSEVIVDGNLVTSRQPSDLPAFMREVMKLARGLREGSGA